MTTGEGGMCLTDNKELADKMRILRSHGMNPAKKYWHDVIGFNYRMTNLQAALGVAQLGKLDGFIERKREIAKWYEAGLKELEEEGLIKLHPEMPWAKCVYWVYSILVKDRMGISKDDLMKKLEASSIETRPLFYPIHVMPSITIALYGHSFLSNNLRSSKIFFLADSQAFGFRGSLSL